MDRWTPLFLRSMLSPQPQSGSWGEISPISILKYTVAIQEEGRCQKKHKKSGTIHKTPPPPTPVREMD